MSDAAPTVAPEKSSFAEDLVDIWFSPSAVFARRAKSGFFLIMCIITLGTGGLFMANRGVTQGIMDGEYRRQTAQTMQRNPSVTQEQMAQGRAMTEKFQVVGLFLFAPIGLLMLGFGVWLAGKTFGAEELGFGTGVMIACWSYLPKVLEGFGVTLQGLLFDTDALSGRFQLTLGVGRFLDPEMSAGLLSLVGRIDVFTLWVSALLGIGICVVGKLPRSKIVPAAVAMWAFGALPAVVQLVWGMVRGG
jgi:hypothetical protein